MWREARTLLSLRAKQDKSKLSTRPAVSDSMGNRPVSRTSGCSSSILTPTRWGSAKALGGQCSSREAHLPEHHCHTGASGFRHTDISRPCLPGQLTLILPPALAPKKVDVEPCMDCVVVSPVPQWANLPPPPAGNKLLSLGGSEDRPSPNPALS